jgi:hypothetical protein
MNKKLITILFVLSLVAPASAQFGGHWTQTECAICGARIYYYTAGWRTVDDGMLSSGSAVYLEEQGREARTIRYDKELYVDDHCYQKYGGDFTESMEQWFDAWLLVQKKNEKDRIVEQRKLDNDFREKKLKNEIEKLKKELKDIKDK